MSYHYPPKISPETEYVISVWRVIDSQWRVNDKHLIGIDFVAAKSMLDVYSVKLTPDLLDQIKFIERRYIAAHTEALQKAKAPKA